MGIDVSALDAQVEEKRLMQQQAVDDDITERLRQMEIDRIIEESNREEAAMKSYLNESVKSDWVRAIEHKQHLIDTEEPHMDPLKSGVSAAQVFAGADPFRKDRVRAQKQQMRSWVFEQIAEKQIIQGAKIEDDRQYDVMMDAVAEIRDAADKEEKEMVHYLNHTVKNENQGFAAARAQKLKEQEDWRKEKAATSVDLKDNLDLAMDEHGRIVRKDQFRGYNDAQTRRIIQQNEDLLAFRRANASANAGADDEWNAQQLVQQQAMEMANARELGLRQDEAMHNLSVIRDQMAAQRQRTNFRSKDRFGAVEPGFFDKFGMSAR
jgi:hypothetical protein